MMDRGRMLENDTWLGVRVDRNEKEKKKKKRRRKMVAERVDSGGI